MIGCSVDVECRGEDLENKEDCRSSNAPYQTSDTKPYVDSLCDRQSITLALTFCRVRLWRLA